MQLDKITARIAPRNAWQSMDLGVRLYQTWFKPLTLIWLTFALPALALILLVSGTEYFWWGCLLWWWLKPLYERPLLHYCARSLFSDAPTLAEVIRTYRAHTLSAILPWLLLRRLDPARAMHLPVTQLESQTGDSYRQRTQNLSLGINDHAGTLTVLFFIIHKCLLGGIIVLTSMLEPDPYYISEMNWVFNGESSGDWMLVGAWFLAATLCEPLYICCGFALYLNKRTWLEGWDLEVGLRHIGDKRRILISKFQFCLAIFVCTLLYLTPLPASAEESQADTNPSQQALEILAGPDFMPMEIKDSWRFKDLFDDNDDKEEKEEEENKSFLERLIDWLLSASADEASETDKAADNFGLPTLAEIFRFILWVIFVSLLILAVLNARKWSALIKAKSPRVSTTTHVAGLDIRAESLPDDIAAQASAAIEKGNVREALSLLYRATLSNLLSRIHIEPVPGATETECLHSLQQADGQSPGVLYLTSLTTAWINTAWAHRPPDKTEAQTLIRNWQAVFEESGAVI